MPTIQRQAKNTTEQALLMAAPGAGLEHQPLFDELADRGERRKPRSVPAEKSGRERHALVLEEDGGASGPAAGSQEPEYRRDRRRTR